MRRDELLLQISALPPDTDIGIQVGGDHLDIADLAPWGEGRFVALKCNSRDLHDMLSHWGIPKDLRKLIALGEQAEKHTKRQDH
ncbi:MAG TPA: hypothetical protein VFG35_04645 [Actinoplanes sp.]|nr:hypothetical protein [Actinoplanes sp.]